MNDSLTSTVDLPTFDTEADAQAWMEAQVDDPCIDNQRFAFLDDVDAIMNYVAKQVSGCCGDFDHEVIVAGRRATVGCNYGH